MSETKIVIEPGMDRTGFHARSAATPTARLLSAELAASSCVDRQKIANRERMMSVFVLTNHSNEAAVAFYKGTGARAANGDELMFVYDR